MIRFDVEIGDRSSGAVGKSLVTLDILAKSRSEAQELFERALTDAIFKSRKDP
jgi:hypothetical protein